MRPRQGDITAYPSDALAARVKGVHVVPDDLISQQAPRIFFSYSGEDKSWVRVFREWFAVRNVRILDYAVEEVGYGELKAALDKQINRSAVFIAFVSADYCKKKVDVRRVGASAYRCPSTSSGFCSNHA